MGVYEELGVRRIINAKGTYTALGGSRMSRETLEAMADAASSFVDIDQLQRALGKKIAEMTHNEAAYICDGACSGVYLALLACVSLKTGKKVPYLTAADRAQSEIILFRSHVSPYSFVFDQLGVRAVELGYSNHPGWTTAEDIENAITEHTAAIYYMESGWLAPGAPELETVCAVAQKHGVPVVLDAAAMLPPVENLWRYCERGADVAIFSGGKDLRGPQASGLMVGSKRIIDTILDFGFPKPGMGRMMKVGREEMAGLYTALKQFLASDPLEAVQDAEAQVILAHTILSGSPCFEVRRCYPNEAGQPIARAGVHLKDTRVSMEDVLRYLEEGEPAIIAAADCCDNRLFYLNPMSMTMEEMELVCKKLRTYKIED